MKRTLLVLACVFLGMAGGAAFGGVEADKDYKALAQAQAPETAGRIEVLEFFQYGCGHCYDFEPAMRTWKAKKPKDVDFRYVPTVWDESRIPQAKIYYALEALGLVDAFHDKVYEAVHEKRLKLWDRPVLDKWVAQQSGIDAQKFAEAYDSFGVNNRVQRAMQMTKAYRISGTPTVSVAGKYLTGPSFALGPNGSPDTARVHAIIDELIGMERKKQAK
jgi:thiol:disulfide interchange protein DsbA